MSLRKGRIPWETTVQIDIPLRAEPRFEFRQRWEVIPADPEISLLHRISAIVSSRLSLDEMLGEVVALYDSSYRV